MNGEVYGVTAYSVRNGKRQTFHSVNESVGDVVEHFADTFDSNTCLLKSCIIKDSTNFICIGIHLTLLKDSVEAKGYWGKEHSPVEALIQKCTIQCVLRYIAKFLNIIGGGTGNRFSPQTHDDERDKEGTQSKTLNLLKLEIPNDFTDAKCLHNY